MSGTHSDTDWISALPDGVLGHILGFLPADEAVRTCVLSRRWLHQWKFMRCLRITSHGVWEKSADEINKFISSLLLLRDPGAALDEVELEFTYEPSDDDGDDDNEDNDDDDDNEDNDDDVHLHALLCRARVLSITLFAEFKLVFNVPPLVSRHLRILELTFLDLGANILDFSSCPSLEVLDLEHCIIRTGKISSHSVKRLSIQDCKFCHDSRTRISVPGLANLQLEEFTGKAPLLESNTSLKTAILYPCSDECCDEGDSGECCGTCAKCCGDDDHKSGCLLLGGLSSATYLKLITPSPEQITFRRDLKWCPTFIKLKKLFLDDWCVTADLRGLVCMLEHSPILEKLTLQLRKGPQRTLEREENHGLMEKSASVSEHLKMITVKCEKVDQRVSKILKFLSTFDIDITIEKNGQIIPFEEVVTNFGLSLEVPPHDQSGVQG
ncbi:FBD-associated F-box protein At5g56370-like isoform X1 [Lolium rigidum]|uniref:FBD-associated F-box protein At5g56370-like isoform X1 n=1 Tax=Lolium rigidum TaxID=89674 RepID=UPI001F5CC90C|nr:FBD-associated F-box protein At5g56370-like isoform X1 [Lolium rigidum]